MVSYVDVKLNIKLCNMFLIALNATSIQVFGRDIRWFWMFRTVGGSWWRFGTLAAYARMKQPSEDRVHVSSCFTHWLV
jgi:hypothetical protein